SSTSESGTYDLIHIEGYDATTPAKGIQIVGNRLINTNATLPRYPVYLKQTAGAIVTNNLIHNCSEAEAVYQEDTSNISVSGNIIY
ncbi:MAG: hypothetical protein EOM23_02720, partial [Candidatus Moranbacteria bacterium]|nr:hypothetical protein [Candidatus Moranbacteria bacterium]